MMINDVYISSSLCTHILYIIDNIFSNNRATSGCGNLKIPPTSPPSFRNPKHSRNCWGEKSRMGQSKWALTARWNFQEAIWSSGCDNWPSSSFKVSKPHQKFGLKLARCQHMPRSSQAVASESAPESSSLFFGASFEPSQNQKRTQKKKRVVFQSESLNTQQQTIKKKTLKIVMSPGWLAPQRACPLVADVESSAPSPLATARVWSLQPRVLGLRRPRGHPDWRR